jgi:hypothetical protein
MARRTLAAFGARHPSVNKQFPAPFASLTSSQLATTRWAPLRVADCRTEGGVIDGMRRASSEP